MIQGVKIQNTVLLAENVFWINDPHTDEQEVILKKSTDCESV